MLSAGTNGQYLQTTGSGLQWATLNTDRISNGTSNVSISAAGGNITAIVGGVSIANVSSAGITLLSSKTLTGDVTGNLTGNVTGLLRPPPVTGTNTSDIVLATMASDDFFRIRVGGTAIDSGYVEFATSDNGDEPIIFRQYSGTFTTLTRTATILDASGNTSFPVLVTSPKFSGNLVGGGSGQVVYQSSANTTAFLAAGTNGQFLQTTGSGLQWATLNADRISNGTSNVNINTSGGTVNTVVNGTTMMSVSSTGITISGGLNAVGPFTLEGFQQTVNSISFTGSGATTAAAYDLNLGTVFYHSASAANWTANFTNLPSLTGSQSRTTVLTIVVQQGATPYIPSIVNINGTVYTVKYVYGITPLGTANALDIFAFTVLRVNGAVTAVMGSYSTYF